MGGGGSKKNFLLWGGEGRRGLFSGIMHFILTPSNVHILPLSGHHQCGVYVVCHSLDISQGKHATGNKTLNPFSLYKCSLDWLTRLYNNRVAIATKNNVKKILMGFVNISYFTETNGLYKFPSRDEGKGN